MSKSHKHRHCGEKSKPISSRATLSPCANTGVFLRGYGPSWSTNPDVPTHCTLFDQNTQLVGVIEDTFGVGTVTHTLKLFDGSSLALTETLDSAVTFFIPIDAQAVRAFPQTAPYEGNSSFRVFFVQENRNDTDPVVSGWVVTGPNPVFLNARYVEARCVYFQKLIEGGNPLNPFDWQNVQCMGSHFFVSEQYGDL